MKIDSGINQISQGTLSEKLHELLVQEIDFENSEVNKFVDNTALNIVLTQLTQPKRITLYKFLSDGRYQEAKSFIDEEIPNFYQQVLDEVKETLKETL